MKALILAGTHERENKFSYKVIDSLLDIYGVSSQPQEFLGIDDARKGQLWNVSKNISVAKVVNVGPISKEYINSLESKARKEQLIDLFKAWGPDNEYQPAYSFNGISQWSSVHQKLIDESMADFYIDLHSYHKLMKGVKGTTLYINSYAKHEFDQVMIMALQEAARAKPEVYGEKNSMPLNRTVERQNSEYVQKFVEDHIDEVISLKKQIEILSSDPLPIDEMSLLKERYFALRERASKNVSGYRIYKNIIAKSNPKWSFTENTRGIELEYPNFLFEAIAWQKEQQEAVASFVAHYLEPQLKLH